MKTKQLFLMLLLIISNAGISSAQNYALDFNGLYNYVKVDTPFGTGLNNFTIETWFYVRGTSYFNAIVTGDGWDAGTVHFQINAAGKVEFAINSGVPDVFSSAAVIQPNRWYHVAVTYDKAAKQVKIYINGALDNTVTLTTAPSANLTASTIGAWSNDTDISRYFNGKLDEMRIWNTIRTAADISGNMYKPLIGNETGLIAYYNFDQNTGEYLFDNTKDGTHTGTLYNFALTGNTSNWVTSTAMSPCISNINNISATGFTVHWNPVPGATNYRLDVSDKADFSTLLQGNVDAGSGTSFVVPINLVAGKNYYCRIRAAIGSYITGYSDSYLVYLPLPAPGNALDFDGTNDYVKVDTPFGTGLDNFTIETWLYARGDFSSNAIINGDGWDAGTVHFQINAAGKVELALNGGSPVSSTSVAVIQPNRWYHVAVTYDQADQQIKFYINGALDNTLTLATAPSANLIASTIGAWSNGTGIVRYFNGRLDEMRIWNTTRTAADISANMYKTLIGDETGLIACYNFDENTGTNLPDRSKDGTHSGTLNNFSLTGTTSNWVTSTTMIPFISNINNISATGFTVHWNPVSGAANYRLDISDKADFSTLLQGNVDAGSGTSFAVPVSIVAGKTYYCRIRAVIGSNTTGSSDPYLFYLPQPMTAPGNALDFDGTDDYVKVAAPLGTSLSNFTIETWLYARGAFSSNAIINGDGWDAGTVHFQINAAGKVEFAINSGVPDVFSSAAVIQPNR